MNRGRELAGSPNINFSKKERTPSRSSKKNPPIKEPPFNNQRHPIKLAGFSSYPSPACSVLRNSLVTADNVKLLILLRERCEAMGV